ncbi:hypothetical protein [Halorhabdus rudnickae]|uniref:hypothetical protein n=1 Tax=Halorhabdus rudnickae TaxID=1775544 RepID=UPI001082F6EF|nr:hypothetical protein [Halorhabdus rudnickae]
MATTDRSWTEIGGQTPTVSSTTRYDLYLLAIPLLFVSAVVVGFLTPVSMQGSIFGASLLGVAILVDSLFVNPPDVGDSR